MNPRTESEPDEPALRQSEDAWRAGVELRLAQGDATMKRLEDGLADNTTMTKQIVANTAGIVAFTSDLEAGAKLLCRIAMGISWTLKTLRQNLLVVVVLLLAIAYFSNSAKLLDICLRLLKAL